MSSRVHRTLAALLLLATVSSCANFHRKPVAAAPPPPPAPELSQTPLYSPQMNENSPRLPTLPATEQSAVVQPPPPPPPKPHHVKKIRPAPVKTTSGTETTTVANGSATPVSGTTGSASLPVQPAIDPAAATASTDKKALTQQAAAAPPAGAGPAGEAPAADSPIGELTTGSTADAAQTSRQTEDLVRNTRSGLDGIKRTLSADEAKTALQIRTFLNRAQQALKNGDVDGAYGLATKAKLLLDELTQK